MVTAGSDPKTEYNKKVNSLYKKLKTLAQYKSLPEAELKSLAADAIEGKISIDLSPKSGKISKLLTEIVKKFSNREEQIYARDLLEQYLDTYAIENISELNTLQEIIYLEVVQVRLQKHLNEMYEQKIQIVPLNIIELMHKNSETISKLKTVLGLNRTKEKANTYDALEHLKKRYKQWREENQASRHLKCPHCSQFILLKMRTGAWEAQGHPFFRDNFLCNRALMSRLGQTVLIDNNFIAEVFETSSDYIPWMLERMRREDVRVIQNDEKAEKLAIKNENDELPEIIVNNEQLLGPTVTEITTTPTESQ